MDGWQLDSGAAGEFGGISEVGEGTVVDIKGNTDDFGEFRFSPNEENLCFFADLEETMGEP